MTEAQFAVFVDEGGYHHATHWSEAGWTWRSKADACHPAYWQRQQTRGWLCREFERWRPLMPHRPVQHVNWHEAQAYCAWSGRRLPTEIEWEAAAAAEPGADGGLAPRPRRFPWGPVDPDGRRANVDWLGMGCADVGALPAGDSAWGCRQMLGNVWEWTASAFEPYPGFAADCYKEYSAPWFATHKVLRGGCWATRGRLLRNTFRNFYLPDRHDVFAGFRTCART